MSNARDYLPELRAANGQIASLLCCSRDLETVRDSLFRYLEMRERRLLEPGHASPRLSRVLANQAIRVCKHVIGRLNEERVGTSALATLAQMAADESIADTVSPGFVLEFIHLFRAICGHPDLYDGGMFQSEDLLNVVEGTGREAARAYSRILDTLAMRMARDIGRYPSGLEPQVRVIRAHNRERIRRYFECSSTEWNDYVWQIRHVITDAETLSALVELTPEDTDAIQRARVYGIPFGITPYYASLMDRVPSDHDHAVRAQVIPPGDYVSCMIEHSEDRATALDFMGEHETSPVDLVTRRYPEIAILKPFNTCAQICVYCQRNWEIDRVLSPSAMASREKLEGALAWIERHRAIREILVTGGDPCLMSDATIFHVLSRLSRIPHISRIRVGTRTPVVLPMRWTEELVGVLAQFHEPGMREVAVVTHFEHSYEVTPEAMEAVQRIRRGGMSVYNQEVFTIENSRRFETARLRKDLRLIGVDPYYTFNLKGKSELQRYRVPIARLLQERREEARLLPGLERTDEPVFNVPRMGKTHLRAGQDHRVIMIRPDGARIYEFDPWEKGITPVPTYLFTDVPIYDYLMELTRRGEDSADYASIWYYY
ncbi:KamA family radical SAM protein [Candidatus Fermentibacteria bacterium]|nr:KamA family radical SAM protein [Candidatus Fermentibacteria bacterium]